ncbi:hypothetical protein B0T21DRAFT_340065 [Apiosordaria backusii]|uniref:Uncharacterized protein n=1 Tax=Apiosordaria backusii TaxID=314023 RepID=A0AA40AER8_9PEZI|nr:hypothetical protein B0T21DRAFT_340065 [Apiosordaria backusii]
MRLAQETLALEQTLHLLTIHPTKAWFLVNFPTCTCYLFYQFYQCGCPDSQHYHLNTPPGGVMPGYWPGLSRTRPRNNPVHLPSRHHCPIARLPQLAQEILHLRGFRHTPDERLPVSDIPVELPFACYTHKEACTRHVTKEELIRRRYNIDTATGTSTKKITKIKRRERGKRELEWAGRHKKRMRELLEESLNTPLRGRGRGRGLNGKKVTVVAEEEEEEAEKFVERWEKMVEAPVDVRLEDYGPFREEQSRDILRDDLVNASEELRTGLVDRVLWPEVGMLGRGEYELGATMVDEGMVGEIARRQWGARRYPWEGVMRLGNVGGEVFERWSMD